MPFLFIQAGTLLRRHLAQFASAVDTQSKAAADHRSACMGWREGAPAGRHQRLAASQHAVNRLNGVHMPQFLLSGLLTCLCFCGGYTHVSALGSTLTLGNVSYTYDPSGHWLGVPVDLGRRHHRRRLYQRQPPDLSDRPSAAVTPSWDGNGDLG